MSQKLDKLIVVIPTWNATDKTIRCLEGVRNWSMRETQFRIVVVDNGSEPGEVQKLKLWIEQAKFSGLNVEGVFHAEHPGLTASLNHIYLKYVTDEDYIMRLDNDVLIDGNSVEVLTRFLRENASASVVGPRVVYNSPPHNLNSAAIFINKWGFRNKIVDSRVPIRCDSLLGAIMIFKKTALDHLGRWYDPELFLFAEEPEICLKLAEQKMYTFYIPRSLAYHDTKVTTAKHPDLSRYLNYRNHALVYGSYFSKVSWVLRNSHLLVRLTLKAILQNDGIPISGLIDGLMSKKIDQSWWRKHLHSKTFNRL